jgi:hypothetical protein
VLEAHGTKWYDIPVGMRSVNGDIPFKEWGLRIPTGDIWREGDNMDKSISRLDVFLQLFSKEQLHDTYIPTNVKLCSKKLRETTKSEILNFFGILILITRYKLNNCSDLWSETGLSKYKTPDQLGQKRVCLVAIRQHLDNQ